MWKKLLLSLAVTLSMALSLIGVSTFAEIPKPQGDIYVQDFANLLTDQQESELIDLGRSLDNQTKAQVAVLTVDTIGTDTIEQYALQAFRQYKLGDKKLNNGVLLVVAAQERQVRIEVGYGLEGALPDGKVGRILDNYALPYLKDNQPDLAIINTYKELYNQTAAEYNLDEYSEAKPYPSSSANQENNQGMETWKMLLIGIGLVIFITIDIMFFGGTFTYLILNIASTFMRGGGRGGPRGGGGGSSGGGGASRGW